MTERPILTEPTIQKMVGADTRAAFCGGGISGAKEGRKEGRRKRDLLPSLPG